MWMIEVIPMKLMYVAGLFIRVLLASTPKYIIRTLQNHKNK